jgi:hypothetical protein
MFRDHLACADVLYTLLLTPCPACGGPHEVALSRITGRFMFRCGTLEFSGSVDSWPETRRQWERQQAAAEGRPA